MGKPFREPKSIHATINKDGTIDQKAAGEETIHIGEMIVAGHSQFINGGDARNRNEVVAQQAAIEQATKNMAPGDVLTWIIRRDTPVADKAAPAPGANPSEKAPDAAKTALHDKSLDKGQAATYDKDRGHAAAAAQDKTHAQDKKDKHDH